MTSASVGCASRSATSAAAGPAVLASVVATRVSLHEKWRTRLPNRTLRLGLDPPAVGRGWCGRGCRENARAVRLPGRLAWNRGLYGAAQTLQGLGEDGLAVGVAAPLLHVGEVSLVRLDSRRGRRAGLVLAGREAAPRTLPLVGDGCVGREARPGLVTVRAPERHPYPGRGLAALRLAHRAGAHPTAAYRVATTHRPPLVTGIVVDLGTAVLQLHHEIR